MTERPPKLILAAVALALGAVAYLAVGVGFSLFVDWLQEVDPSAADELALIDGFFTGLCVVFGLASALLVIPLYRRKRWAWIVSLVVMATYAASAFLPIGALGLWGLLDKPSREWFGFR